MGLKLRTSSGSGCNSSEPQKGEGSCLTARLGFLLRQPGLRTHSLAPFNHWARASELKSNFKNPSPSGPEAMLVVQFLVL